MAYDSEHGKLWQDIKADLDKTRARASKFAHDAEWAFGRRTVRVLAAMMLFTVIVALLLVFLNWYIAPIKPGEKKDLVLAVAQILAGTALLSGLYFTWRSLQANREGQITERFTRAIDHLDALITTPVHHARRQESELPVNNTDNTKNAQAPIFPHRIGLRPTGSAGHIKANPGGEGV